MARHKEEHVYPIEGRTWILERASELWPNTPEHEHADMIRTIIDGWGVDDPDRLTLEMYAWERATYREIALALGLADRPAGYYRVKRALSRLRKELIENEFPRPD
jgi:hypothetical protein